MSYADQVIRHTRTLESEVEGMECGVCSRSIEPGQHYTWLLASYEWGDHAQPTTPSEPAHYECVSG